MHQNYFSKTFGHIKIRITKHPGYLINFENFTSRVSKE